MTDCRRVKVDIREGLEDRWRDHLTQCDDCRLFAENRQLPTLARTEGSDLSADGLAHLFAQIQSETTRLSPGYRLASLSAGNRLVLGIAVTLVIGIFVLLFKRRADFFIYPSMRFTLELVGMGMLLTVYLWLLCRPLHQPQLQQWRRVGLVVATVFMVAIPLILPMAHHGHPASLKGVGEDLVSAAAACFFWGSSIGAVLAGLGWFMVRGGKKARRFNMPLLFAAGMLALFSLHLHCPIVHSIHIALGHSSIMIGIWGIALVRHILRRRPPTDVSQ